MFSVIIATRNRPSLFRQALNSVQAQTCDSVEIVVVNDGSDEKYMADYQEAIQLPGKPVCFHSLVRRRKGHGAAYARNTGVSFASGQYLCFLDDDDVWTDDGYLSRIQSFITKRGASADLIFSNQAAFVGDQRKEGPIWLEGLAARLEGSARLPEGDGLYRVTVDDLLGSGGFCHMNTMIVRNALFDRVAGMDEVLRWEEDHDLFLRLIDRAETMLLSSAFVCRHNIPDPAQTSSTTTSLTELERRLNQLRVFDNASLFATHQSVRAYGQRHKGYALKRVAQTLAKQNHYSTAAFYAREALGVAPTLKWAGYWCYLMLRAFQNGRKAQGR